VVRRRTRSYAHNIKNDRKKFLFRKHFLFIWQCDSFPLSALGLVSSFSASGDLMRALDSFFESGGEVPEGGADAPMGDAGEDDESGDDLDEEQLGRAEAGAGTVPVFSCLHLRQMRPDFSIAPQQIPSGAWCRICGYLVLDVMPFATLPAKNTAGCPEPHFLIKKGARGGCSCVSRERD